MNTNKLYELALPLLARRILPDCLIAYAVRHSTKTMLRSQWQMLSSTERQVYQQAFIARLKDSPIAIHTTDANEQHYELPTTFFELVLGPRLKYSACYWREDITTLADAEEDMLQLTAKRAQIEDGQSILELGCGWGSLCLWLAENYPNCELVAVSNSRTQRAYIERQAAARGLHNVQVITADMNDFEIDQQFDRVLSIEMFEHIKNYEALLAKIAQWLKSEGLLFIHIFTHHEYAYAFEAGEDDWMTQYFFAGGNMPSANLLTNFQQDLTLQQQWTVDGTHYEKTLRAWLAAYDRQRKQIMPLLEKTYGVAQADRWWVNWRLFFLGCAEVFGLYEGTEYQVSHYLFTRPC